MPYTVDAARNTVTLPLEEFKVLVRQSAVGVLAESARERAEKAEYRELSQRVCNPGASIEDVQRCAHLAYRLGIQSVDVPFEETR
jgi:hypothetical protein